MKTVFLKKNLSFIIADILKIIIVSAKLQNYPVDASKPLLVFSVILFNTAFKHLLLLQYSFLS
jgi:hypothetical protein